MALPDNVLQHFLQLCSPAWAGPGFREAASQEPSLINASSFIHSNISQMEYVTRWRFVQTPCSRCHRIRPGGQTRVREALLRAGKSEPSWFSPFDAVLSEGSVHSVGLTAIFDVQRVVSILLDTQRKNRFDSGRQPFTGLEWSQAGDKRQVVLKCPKMESATAADNGTPQTLHSSSDSTLAE